MSTRAEQLEQLKSLSQQSCQCTYEQLAGQLVGICRTCEAIDTLERIERLVDAQLRRFFREGEYA